MESLEHFANRLTDYYQEMGQAFSQYQASQHLPCLSGCGSCCLNPEVEASVYEMIPMALHFYTENRAEAFLGQLQESTAESCALYHRDTPDGEKGHCSEYHHRPTLCREFGVSGFAKKDGTPTLSVCKKIKAAHPDEFEKANRSIDAKLIPMMAEWTMKLMQLRPELIQERKPINQALREALEKVLLYKYLSDS